MTDIPMLAPILLYIDVGSGFLWVQIIIGGILGSLFFVRSLIATWLHRVKMIFVRQPADTGQNQSPDDG